MAKPITLSHQVRSGGWESLISANGGLPAHRYTPQVTPRLPRGSEPASKLNPLFCGVWSSALFFGSKTMDGHPNQRFWGVLSWVGGDIRKKPPPQAMISIIASCISASRFSFQKSVLIFSQPPKFQLKSGGVAECCAIVWVVESLLALGFSSLVLVFWWGEKPVEAPRRPPPLGTSRLGEVFKSTRPRLLESPHLPRRLGRNMP